MTTFTVLRSSKSSWLIALKHTVCLQSFSSPSTTHSAIQSTMYVCCRLCVFACVLQADAPLAIRPMLPYLTRSEIHAVMTGGFATIAGSVLAAYIMIGVSSTFSHCSVSGTGGSLQRRGKVVTYSTNFSLSSPQCIFSINSFILTTNHGECKTNQVALFHQLWCLFYSETMSVAEFL